MTPDLTSTLQIGYDWAIGDGQTITPMLQESYVGKYWAYDVNVKGAEQSAYTKTDLRITWNIPKKGVELEAFVENLENKAVLTRAVVFNDSNADPNRPTTSIQAHYGDPRIWGVRLKVRF